MFEIISERYVRLATGKSMPTIMEEVTGINARTWQTGGPKRASQLEKVQNSLHHWSLATLRDRGGYSEAQAQRITSIMLTCGPDDGFLTQLVRGYTMIDRHEWPRTVAVARQIDGIAHQLRQLRTDEDLPGFTALLLADGDTGSGQTCRSAMPDHVTACEMAASAQGWGQAQPLLTHWMLKSILKFLACWDVEFTACYLTEPRTGRGMQPVPIFAALLPSLGTKSNIMSTGQFRRRGLFQLPLRHLIRLSFCMAYSNRYEKWPPAFLVKDRQIAARGWPLYQSVAMCVHPLTKIHSGSRSLRASEFAALWDEMGGNNVMPPWPCYIAAQLLTILLTMRTPGRKDSPVTTLIQLDPSNYRHWWDHYYANFKSDGIVFGTFDWPSYLKLA